jgi:hypothetical protein
LRQHFSALGALVGFAGAQVFAVVLFFVVAEPCDCGKLCEISAERCIWGQTFGEYWTKVGTIAGAFFALIGGLIGDSAKKA